MKRMLAAPRADWRERVESQGLLFHSDQGLTYWDESVYYVFSATQIDQLEEATNELHRMCLKAVQYLIDHCDDAFPLFEIPPNYWDWICASWERDPHAIYGRFDLAYDGRTPPKMLEYNADTPSSLLEAAVIQWYWLQDLHPGADQFNSLHERLIEAFRRLKLERKLNGTFFFASCDPEAGLEDYMTVTYLRDTAMQAGLTTEFIALPEIGIERNVRYFRDFRGTPQNIEQIFKLYPWEWLLQEEFGKHLPNFFTSWFEPPWKMLLSNKALLPILWKMFPKSPYLLPADFHADKLGDSYVRKPLFGREGQNVQIIVDDEVAEESGGQLARDTMVYQQYYPLPNFNGNYPVIGSWVVAGEAGGMGIRETAGLITGNSSRFVPHLFTHGLERLT